MDIFTYFENKFDQLTYQNDKFFWLLVLFNLVCYIAGMANWVNQSDGFVTAIIVALFATSWVYTNARRRGVRRALSFLYSLLTYFFPLIGGIVYFKYRPGELIITFLPPQKQIPFPISIADQAFMFLPTPFRFLLKLVFWMMGLTFLLISILSMFGLI